MLAGAEASTRTDTIIIGIRIIISITQIKTKNGGERGENKERNDGFGVAARRHVDD